jgi:signal recognition particle subunit SEC65
MDSDNPSSKAHRKTIVELMRVQPIEAEVIAARLRAAGIEATVGADSVYPSVTFADGVAVYVSEDDAPGARAVLEDQGQPD